MASKAGVCLRPVPTRPGHVVTTLPASNKPLIEPITPSQLRKNTICSLRPDDRPWHAFRFFRSDMPPGCNGQAVGLGCRWEAVSMPVDAGTLPEFFTGANNKIARALASMSMPLGGGLKSLPAYRCLRPWDCSVQLAPSNPPPSYGDLPTTPTEYTVFQGVHSSTNPTQPDSFEIHLQTPLLFSLPITSDGKPTIADPLAIASLLTCFLDDRATRSDAKMRMSGDSKQKTGEVTGYLARIRRLNAMLGKEWRLGGEVVEPVVYMDGLPAHVSSALAAMVECCASQLEAENFIESAVALGMLPNAAIMSSTIRKQSSLMMGANGHAVRLGMRTHIYPCREGNEESALHVMLWGATVSWVGSELVVAPKIEAVGLELLSL